MKRERKTTKVVRPMMLGLCAILGLTLATPAAFGAQACTAVITTTGTPTTVCPGMTNAYRITITNTTTGSSDAIKSIAVTIPQGFVITGAVTLTPPVGKNWTQVAATGQIKLKCNAANSDKLAVGQAIQISFTATAPDWADWLVGVDPSTDTVAPGGSTSATVSVSATAPAGAPTYEWTTGAWTGMDWTGTPFPPAAQPTVTVDATATLSADAADVPAGVTINFDPSSDEPDFTSTMSIDVGTTVAPGTYPIDIILSCAACDEVLGSTTFTLVVAAPEDYEGYSHGYWKTHDWPTPYDPAALLGSVFDLTDFPTLASVTLRAALDFGGGPELQDAAQLLLLQAVAALLNAADPDINYPLTEAAVISQVNAALDSGDRATILELQAELDTYNNLSE